MRILPRNPWPIALNLPLGMLAAAVTALALLCPGFLDETVRALPVLDLPAKAAGVPEAVDFLARCGQVFGVVALAVSVLGLLVRQAWVLRAMRTTYLLAYLMFAVYVFTVNRATGFIFDEQLFVKGIEPTPVNLFLLRFDFVWPAACAVLLVALMHLYSCRRTVIAFYSRVYDETPAAGDRIVENVLTNGADPQYRKSLISSVFTHVMVIIVIPWLLSMRGCVSPYRVPKGSGTPSVAMAARMKLVQKKKPKKRQKFVVNPKSTISFQMPELDDSQISSDVSEATEMAYTTDKSAANARSGRMGQGGGKEGGWPLGMEQGKVRFIRLEHKGHGWDDGMDPISRADINFLDEFKKLTGFKVENHGESHPIRLLSRYPKGFAPPFVYMTGDGPFDVPERDVKVLSEYLKDGGMLFGDCGAPAFGQSFRQLATSLLGERMVEISDDDPLFREPYVFLNGAPPLWHHDGRRALGVKYKGRWAIFYHPGDINDAWKTGHSGMRKDLADGAYQMGVNIVYYSFTRYLELTAKYRKK